MPTDLNNIKRQMKNKTILHESGQRYLYPPFSKKLKIK